jgi:hypothetical protein
LYKTFCGMSRSEQMGRGIQDLCCTCLLINICDVGRVVNCDCGEIAPIDF